MSTSPVTLQVPLCRKEYIHAAIVITLADLGGFHHPAFGRSKKGKDQKGFTAIPSNFIAFSLGYGFDGKDPVMNYSHMDLFDTHLAACKHILASCQKYHCHEKPAIQELIKIILREDRERKEKIAESTSHYFFPLSHDTGYGRAILALSEVFEISIPEEQLAWKRPEKLMVNK